MADRRRQVIQLLATRYDGLYLPPGSLVTPAGLVPAQREPCTSCGGVLIRDDFGKEIRRRKGRGWTRDRFGRREPCTVCDAVGWIARDPMDASGVRVGSATTTSTARPRATVKCDACNGDGAHGNGQRCHICRGDGRRDLHAFELRLDTRDVDERDPLDNAIDERNQTGSYAELDRALAGIAHHVNKPVRYQPVTMHARTVLRLLDECFLPPAATEYSDLDEWSQELVDRALEYIAQRLPDPIKVPAEVRANAKAQAEWRRRVKGKGSSAEALKRRDQEIRKAARSVPVQRVAFEYGLSVSQVNRIVNGEVA